MKYATRNLLGTIWTLAYEEKDGLIVIYQHTRDLEIGYKQEKELPQFRLLEDDYRLVEGVAFKKYEPNMTGLEAYGKFIEVVNPKHVFGYNK